MSYYDDPKNAEDYVEMAKGYDGAALIDLLEPHLAKGASVLELGMGPGVDLDILAEKYKPTGSDYSAYFVDRYKEQHADADVIELDAAKINTDRTFDCIYSNKVMHQFSDEQLNFSFAKQRDALNASGLILHSYWLGDEVMDIHGMTFYYRSIKDVTARLASHFELIDAQEYTEMEEDDSFWVLAKKR